MNPKFDYEYVCYAFSGLTGWTLKSGDPENVEPLKPVVFVHGADTDAPQTAVFNVNHAGDFNMDIHDAQGNYYSKIVECSREYMEREFGDKAPARSGVNGD
jgi:hypothetical protein